MRPAKIIFAFFTLIYLIAVNATASGKAVYFTAEKRQLSPGNTSYFIDPLTGNDKNNGKSKAKPWKTFTPANRLIFSLGDKLIVLSPGVFHTSLMLMAKGTSKKPISVLFAPGQYHLYNTDAYHTKLNISNANDRPEEQKAIALYIIGSKNVMFKASGAKFIFHAKMIETCIDHSENISIEDISYDYHIPTVSEFKVIAKNSNYADLQVNKDSKYSVTDSLLTWEGDGWRSKNSWYWQEFNPATGYLTRTDLSLDKARFADLGNNKLRVFYTSDPGIKQGFVYQTRDVTRDCAGIFLQHSKNILFKNVRIYFMHGMGIVSQLCQNITMDAVVVKPDPASGRTCAAWADILHFSGCSGRIEIKNSYLSAANDDAINVHGVHLRIIEKPAPNQLRVRFMHGQTFGFNAYQPGDSIELIHGNSLLAFAHNVVTRSEMINDKEILLTLKDQVASHLLPDDAVENVTRTPEVFIHHNIITSIPTRGILVTTRRKVVIEDNKFLRTALPAILVEDDAEGWFESGMVKNLAIRNNSFVECGEPVISIHPENSISAGPVHRNLQITGNQFTLSGSKVLSAKSTANITFNDNMIITPKAVSIGDMTEFKDCLNVKIDNNRIQ
ncbi:MAG TPA: right-handed parallel beta-helix repeat-containing protein [Mucilaginibacter sp.]|nr:right-handed parallel beta-helix repeat-containing protein [Mucilaginibacter sp.]